MVRHVPSWNHIVGAMFCEADGEPWDPCLFVRQKAEEQREAATYCLCSHTEALHNNLGVGRCTVLSCGCMRMRPREVAE